MTTDIDNKDSNFFTQVEVQVARCKGGMAENPFEGTPSTLCPSKDILPIPCLTSPGPVPSSSFTASLPVTPQHMPSNSTIPLSPITPQPEDSNEKISCHPKLGCICNIGTNVSDNIYYYIISTIAIYHRTMLCLSYGKKSIAMEN
jgi:hypothetical protein